MHSSARRAGRKSYSLPGANVKTCIRGGPMTGTTDLAAGPSVIDAAFSPTLTSPPSATAQADWSLTTRTGFGFAATYCVLYVFSMQMFGALVGSVLGLLPFRVMP